jgi:predicted AAA+ superfamily ATPase
MIARARLVREVRGLLRQFPVVAIVGARQVGKSTLARLVVSRAADATVFDLEKTADLRRLDEPSLALGKLRGIVVLDEVQRRPELFPTLRVLADRPRTPARFLVLGSASPELLRQTSETLAGRIATLQLEGFDLGEVTARKADRLWLRGGFPRSFLARSETESFRWRQEFLATFLERDLPGLGFRTPAPALDRFWHMLAHWHGQLLNSSEIGRSLGVTDATVRHYLDVLASTFVIRVLPPFHENLAKRQVKAPKIFVADSGLLHTLLGIEDSRGLERHPKLGASWEGFAVAQILSWLRVRRHEGFFWRTHECAELDLLVVRGGRRYGFEIKRTDAPEITRSMRIALSDLRLDRLDVIHAGAETYPLGERIRALPLSRILEAFPPK